MSDDYTPLAVRHDTITTITDDDVISAAAISVPLEELADNIMTVVQRYVLRDGDTWTVPGNLIGVRIQMIGPGTDGGVGGTTGGGGGGAAGGYLDEFFPGASFPAAGTVFTATNTSGSDFRFSGSGLQPIVLAGTAGAAAVTVTGGAGGNAGRPSAGFAPGGVAGVGGAAGVQGGDPSIFRYMGAGGGGGSAGASGGRGGDTSIMFANAFGVGGGAGASVNATQGNGGSGFGAGGGGGGGSTTGRGGGGGGGFYVPEYPAQAAGGGAVSTAGAAGSPGVCVLTVFRGGA